MNYTIHLTENCNLRCKYCYESNYYSKENNEIDFENIKKIIDRDADKNTGNVTFTFYGGEPLLKKELIYKTISYISSLNTNTKFRYSMTTNGTLLDDDFLKFLDKNPFVNISFSIDGTCESHNLNRIFENQKGSYELVEKNAINMLNKLSNKTNVVAMMVITKNNVQHLSKNIEHLYKIGFKQFNTLFNYSDDWSDDELSIISKELEKVSDFYYKKMMNGEDISVTIIDEKIRTHVDEKYNCNNDCILKKNDVNVGIDGKFYFCMQFVYNSDFVMGDCTNGIDEIAQKKILSSLGIEIEECKNCAIRKRCKHQCPCKNYISTHDVNGLSPFVCELERIAIDVADRLAEKLYKSNSQIFTRKFYFIEN